MHIKRAHIAILISAILGSGQLAASNRPADPTRPARLSQLSKDGEIIPAGTRWLLSSTLIASDRRVAVINGKRISEGESIDNATVLRIRKLDVLIQSNGKHITLELLPDILNNLPVTMEQ